MMKQRARWFSCLLVLAALMSVMTLTVLAEDAPVLKLEGYNGELLTLEKGEITYLPLKVKDDAAFAFDSIAIDNSSKVMAEFEAGFPRLKVSALSGSTEIVTVTLNGKVGGVACAVTCKVKVNAAVNSVDISQGDQILDVGHSFTYKATYGPSDATDITTVWKSSDPKVATIDADGKVTAIAPGRTKISVTVGGMAAPIDKTVNVSGLTMKQPEGTLLVGKSMSIEYGAFGTAEEELQEWTSSNQTVAGVSGGNVYAYAPGKTTITLKAGQYTVSCTVTVEEDVASAIIKSIGPGEMLKFSDILEDLNERAENKLELSLDYISALSVDPDEGVIYYGYTSSDSPGMGVGSMDCFYRMPDSSQMGINDLVFVPNKNFGGTALISYVGYGEGVPFSGRIRLTVEKSADVIYRGEAGKPVFFSAEDFSAACRVKTGQALRYVTFRVPAKSEGALYQSYNTAGQYMPLVSDGTKYHVSGNALRIDEVTFVPEKSFSGTVNIPYTATDSSGNSFSGNISITVSPSSGGEDGSGEGSWVENAVSYTTNSGTEVLFAGEDFEKACLKANGKKLKYISFTLPAEREGKLCVDYFSEEKPGTAVTAAMQNTVSKLSKISFVPKVGFSGTVKIPFTGLDVADKEFNGTVTIRVLSYEVQVEYETAAMAVSFDAEDFRFSAVSALPKKLASVEFVDLPDEYEGKLLLNYKGVGTGTAVTEGTRYYYSGTPAINKITFVPKVGYRGMVEFPYVAYDGDGNSVSGVVTIYVSPGAAKLEFTDLTGYTNLIPAISYLKDKGVIGGYSDGTFRPTAATSRAAYAAMVCRLFNFKALVTEDPYPDVGRDSWCAETAAAAKRYGIIYGDKQGMFNPTASVTKQQAVVMLQRAMEAAGREVPKASTYILESYKDSASVSNYARSAMANMIALGVVEGDYLGYLRPDTPITRAEMAMILYRLLAM